MHVKSIVKCDTILYNIKQNSMFLHLKIVNNLGVLFKLSNWEKSQTLDRIFYKQFKINTMSDKSCSSTIKSLYQL